MIGHEHLKERRIRFGDNFGDSAVAGLTVARTVSTKTTLVFLSNNLSGDCKLVSGLFWHYILELRRLSIGDFLVETLY